MRSPFARLSESFRRPRRVLVLCYHRVAALNHDPHQLAVSPGRFAEHLEVIRSIGEPIRLSELRGYLNSPFGAGQRVCVTFDDGYADNLSTALPLLERAAVPATVFVVTDALSSWDRFPWDDAPTDDGEPTRPRANGSASANFATPRTVLTPEQFDRLAAHRLIDIGAHTASHPRLSDCPVDAQRREVQSSRRWLSDRLGREVTSMAYPHGAYSRLTVQIARESGFELACTVQAGAAWRGSDLLQLPRLTIRDQDAGALDRRLRTWLAQPLGPVETP